MVIIIAAVVGGMLGTNSSSPGGKEGNSDSDGVSTANSQANDTSGDESGLKAALGARLAMTTTSDGQRTLAVYYQAADGRIVENIITEGADNDGFSVIGDLAVKEGKSTTINATTSVGKPMVAIAYANGAVEWLRIFFVAPDTTLWTTKKEWSGSDGDWTRVWEDSSMIKVTDDNEWNTSAAMSTPYIASGSGLAVCTSTALAQLSSDVCRSLTSV